MGRKKSVGAGFSNTPDSHNKAKIKIRPYGFMEIDGAYISESAKMQKA
jgi:hypothetical protein